MPKPPIQLRSRDQFDTVFARELLKSEYRRSLLLVLLSAAAGAVAVPVMFLGRSHFESIGDTDGSRYWLLLVLVGMVTYKLAGLRVLAGQIRRGQPGSGRLRLMDAVVEPSAVSAWLFLEGMFFEPGAMLDSPLSYAYPVIVLLSALQLSWRLCLLTSVVSALQYMTLVAWHWFTLHGSLPETTSAYLPLHGMRAVTFLFCGMAAAFVAREISKGIATTLRNLEERDHVLRVFGRYVTDEVVDDILRSPEGLRLGGRRRTVTVMMADLRGFTPLAESLPPEDVIAILNNFLASMTEVIVRHRGTIDELIGDAILVIFGAPLAAEDDAERAVECAIEMQHAMEEVNRYSSQNGFPRLEMGIGIHTGLVVAGNIGSEKRSKYGVVGSAVNLASRIQSVAAGEQILASAATAQLLGERLHIGERLTIQAKGFAGPVEIYDVIGMGALQATDLPPQPAL
jgi:class 3 adenylate cyclase